MLGPGARVPTIDSGANRSTAFFPRCPVDFQNAQQTLPQGTLVPHAYQPNHTHLLVFIDMHCSECGRPVPTSRDHDTAVPFSCTRSTKLLCNRLPLSRRSHSCPSKVFPDRRVVERTDRRTSRHSRTVSAPCCSHQPHKDEIPLVSAPSHSQAFSNS